MKVSRQARIIALLVIDTAFFFLEVIVGYAVGSLALVADSFHMLNDVLSLIIALYTIKLATAPSSSANSYGWQRAEILGALINGVFLVALSVTIALEAIGRFITPSDITNPKLIVVVGSLGLASNIVGLFLFHEHGHGGHSHSHGPIALPEPADDEPASGGGLGRARSNSIPSLYQHPAETRAQIIEAAHEIEIEREVAMSPPTHARFTSSGSRRYRRGSGSHSRPRAARSGSNSAPVPPLVGSNETRPPTGAGTGAQPADLTASEHSEATAVGESSPTQTPSYAQVAAPHTHTHKHKHVHLAQDADVAERGTGAAHHGHAHGHGAGDAHGDDGHVHDDADKDDGGDHAHGHGHSHGSMNMHGVFLHVLGDALGNIGVIAAGLVIWFCKGDWRFYFDPGVSLVITCIIFSSAIPLVKSASIILLQGVPNHVSLEAVRASVKAVGGVASVHELHVWQLSESTVVASVHVLIVPGSDYMAVANGIRAQMHTHGVHSVTIQPEFVPDDYDEHAADQEGTACLIRCPPDSCGADTCCPPIAQAQTQTGMLVDVDEADEHAHDHANGNGHGHDHNHAGHSH
ncbi:Zinc resistance conferring protein [Cryptotrichosporon argae]